MSCVGHHHIYTHILGQNYTHQTIMKPWLVTIALGVGGAWPFLGRSGRMDAMKGFLDLLLCAQASLPSHIRCDDDTRSVQGESHSSPSYIMKHSFWLSALPERQIHASGAF